MLSPEFADYRQLKENHYAPSNQRSRNTYKHPDKRPFDVEPIIMVGGGHVFRAGDDEMLVVAEPEAVEHKSIEPVHHHPESVCCQCTAPEGLATVDITHQQTQQDPENHHGDNLLGVESGASRTVARIH